MSASERMKAMWEKRRAEGWVHPKKGTSKKNVNGSLITEIPIAQTDVPFTWFDDTAKKIDAILDVLSNRWKSLDSNIDLVAAINPLRERIKKLHDVKFNGKEFHVADITGFIGVTDIAQKKAQNEALWQQYKMDVASALLKAEGFELIGEGRWKVGQ